MRLKRHRGLMRQVLRHPDVGSSDRSRSIAARDAREELCGEDVLSARRLTLGQGALVWSLCFAICLGLGYPTLNRYDPRRAGNLDANVYYELVVGAPSEPTGHLRYRMLVPYLARPFYWLGKDRLGTWEPVFFGLLVANAMCSATAAALLVSVGSRFIGDHVVGLLGATLYLLSFAVPNFHLSGLVDSGEAALMMAVAWALSRGRWALLPVLGVVGALAKETFVPLAVMFATGWWVAERDHCDRLARALLVAAMGAAGSAAVVISLSIAYGRFVLPWEDAVGSHPPGMGYVAGLLRGVLSRNFWYVFAWLIPLGVWRLGRLPRAWVQASAFAVVAALAMGAYMDSQGNVSRAVFNVAGPVLSLSVAMLLTRGARASGESRGERCSGGR